MPGEPEQQQDIQASPDGANVDPAIQTSILSNEGDADNIEDEIFENWMSQAIHDRIHQLSSSYEDIDNECKDVVLESDKSIELHHEIANLKQQKASLESQAASEE